MKKIILILTIFSLMLIGLASAEQTVTILDLQLPTSYGTGEQITANVLISNVSYSNIKRTYLQWENPTETGNSWVDCRKMSHTSNSKTVQCILTVTPNMNKTLDVFVFSEIRGQIPAGDNPKYVTTNKSILLGNFPFAGTTIFVSPSNPFTPAVNYCHKEEYCQKYVQDCYYEYNCRSYSNTGNCRFMSKKKICEPTDECAKIRTINVCVR